MSGFPLQLKGRLCLLILFSEIKPVSDLILISIKVPLTKVKLLNLIKPSPWYVKSVFLTLFTFTKISYPLWLLISMSGIPPQKYTNLDASTSALVSSKYVSMRCLCFLSEFLNNV